MTTQLAHGGHCEQDFRWYWCRKTPLNGARRLAKTFLRFEFLRVSKTGRLILWFKIAALSAIPGAGFRHFSPLPDVKNGLQIPQQKPCFAHATLLAE